MKISKNSSFTSPILEEKKPPAILILVTLILTDNANHQWPANG